MGTGFTASSQHGSMLRFSFQPVAEHRGQGFTQRQFCGDLRCSEAGGMLGQGRGRVLKKQLNDLSVLRRACWIDLYLITGAGIDALSGGSAGCDAEEPSEFQTKLHRKVP